MTDLTNADLERLSAWDTPTICNGLEALDQKYRLTGFSRHQFQIARPDLKPIVGYARTATIRAGVEPAGVTPAEMTERRIAYYTYIAEGGPTPSVTVIQDLDTEPGAGAWWGEVNSTVHRGLGALGVVTNGSIRDLTDWAEGFQALAGRIGPSHAHVHVTGFGERVEVHGMTVDNGDIIHADLHGAVVVPADCVKRLPDAIAAIARRESVLLAAARADDFNIGKLKAAMAASAKVT